MLRNRLIFGLIYNDGCFVQSRNFRLQRVGDINWLEKNYKFQEISFSLDELIVFDATRNEKNIKKFSETVSRLVGGAFIPVSVGGGIRKIEDAELLFKSGADKVVLNSSLYTDPALVVEIINRYGSQSLVASVDYRILAGSPTVHIHNGSQAISTRLDDYFLYLERLGVGEIILNSIDNDGTGFGYDIDSIEKHAKCLSVPLIIMGGAGNEVHLASGLSIEGVSAVATANLFNFIGNGLPNARSYMLEHGANLARWE